MEQMLSFLEPVNDWLDDTFGTLGPLYGIGFLGLALILLTLPSFLARPEDPLDRLKRRASETKTDQNAEEKQRLRHAAAPNRVATPHPERAASPPQREAGPRPPRCPS